MSDTAISRAAETGRLHRVFRGAFAVGHAPLTERERLMAAALACGKGAVRPMLVQRAGRAPMTPQELLRGFAIQPGTLLQ